MNRQWLCQTGSARLICVFGGWRLGVAPFAALTGEDDVLFFEDYTKLDAELPEADSYDHVSVLAYSFGVASALHWLDQTGLRPDRLVAVNGTPCPADEDRGIAPAVVAATADGLTPESFAKFCRRSGFRDSVPAIDITEAQAELRAIAARGPAPARNFDRIWISDRDRIIPPQAQEAAWADQNDVVRHIPAAHQPFQASQTWEAWLA